MTARARRAEVRRLAAEIAARYQRPVRALAWEDGCALHDLRCEHTGLVALESGADAAIREMSDA